jgi:hypothetical protein
MLGASEKSEQNAALIELLNGVRGDASADVEALKKSLSDRPEATTIQGTNP